MTTTMRAEENRACPPWIQELVATGAEVLDQEPLARHTTWRVGGPAEAFVVVDTQEQLQAILQILRQKAIPWYLLGRGSNLLVRDSGWQGVVIQLGTAFASFEVDEEKRELHAGASCPLAQLAVATTKRGWTGLEFAIGIPGNVGGAIFMNAGAHGQEIAQILVNATILWEEGEIVTLPTRELAFSYRSSLLQQRRGIVLAGLFQLQASTRPVAQTRLARYRTHRLQTQPLTQPCAGSAFRNPPGDSAGRLIEQAGLKGFRIGDAEVSTLHGNFLLNCGQATATDLLALMEHVQQTVAARFGVQLVPEVRVLGEEKKER